MKKEEWERLQLAQEKATLMAERELERVRKQLNKQLVEENARLASAQKAQ